MFELFSNTEMRLSSNIYLLIYKLKKILFKVEIHFNYLVVFNKNNSLLVFNTFNNNLQTKNISTNSFSNDQKKVQQPNVFVSTKSKGRYNSKLKI